MPSLKLSSVIPRRLSSALCLMAACLMLTACGTSTTPLPRPMLPANLAQPCPPVPTLDTNDFDELAQAHMALAIEYGQCRARHRALVDAWRDVPR